MIAVARLLTNLHHPDLAVDHVRVFELEKDHHPLADAEPYLNSGAEEEFELSEGKQGVVILEQSENCVGVLMKAVMVGAAADDEIVGDVAVGLADVVMIGVGGGVGAKKSYNC